MAKTRTLTATLEDGTQTTRKTARNYTHVVEVFTKMTWTHDDGTIENYERYDQKWCGRPDLMQKIVNKFQGNPEIRTKVGQVTNDPWAE